MSVQRYERIECDSCISSFQLDAEGEWVKHADYAAAVAKLEGRVRELEEAARAVLALQSCMGTRVMEVCAILRAALSPEAKP